MKIHQCSKKDHYFLSKLITFNFSRSLCLECGAMKVKRYEIKGYGEKAEDYETFQSFCRNFCSRAAFIAR